MDLIQNLKTKTEKICADFSDFTNGYRVLMLLQRTKDGGHNKEEKRVFETLVSNSKDAFEYNLFKLLLIKSISSFEARIYLSLNPRNPKKVIRYIEKTLLESHYVDETNRENNYKKLLINPRHFLMQPECRDGNLFLIDVDNEDGKDNKSIALKKIEELGLEQIKCYQTKNGWHFIVKPFNHKLWNSVGEIKKDALILLDY